MINIKYNLTAINFPEAAEELEKLKKLQQEKNLILNELAKKFPHSHAARFLKHFIYCALPNIREETGTCFVEIPEMNMNKAYHPDPIISLPSDKTLNLLLSSKILTEQEKRKLLKDYGFIKDEPGSINEKESTHAE